jgi:hypothetical protein
MLQVCNTQPHNALSLSGMRHSWFFCKSLDKLLVNDGENQKRVWLGFGLASPQTESADRQGPSPSSKSGPVDHPLFVPLSRRVGNGRNMVAETRGEPASRCQISLLGSYLVLLGWHRCRNSELATNLREGWRGWSQNQWVFVGDRWCHREASRPPLEINDGGT